jgi:hypothetical protein
MARLFDEPWFISRFTLYNNQHILYFRSARKLALHIIHQADSTARGSHVTCVTITQLFVFDKQVKHT